MAILLGLTPASIPDSPIYPHSDGERNAVRLGERLKGMTFAKVFTSPLQRAARTCELAGFGTEQKSIQTWSNGTMAI